MKIKNIPYGLPILSGILIGTSYIPFPPWALFFCMVPLWLFCLKTKSYKKLFIAGWITQFVLNAIGFHWIAHTVTEFGQMPWGVGIAVLILFCTLAHLYYPLSLILWRYLSEKFSLSKQTSLLLLPVTFLCIERIYPFIFYWHLGYTWLWARFPGAQAAEWIGFYGLNVASIFVNWYVLRFFKQRKTGKRWNRNLAYAIGLVVSLNILGGIAGMLYQSGDKKLKVIAVQGNIGNLNKIQAVHGGRALDVSMKTFFNLSNKAIEAHPDAELLVWPETAFGETIYPNRYPRMYFGRLLRFLKQKDIDLLTGAYQRIKGSRKPFNSIVLVDRMGEIQGSYKKTHLLAYGEYFPGAETFPILKKWFPMVSDFGRGNGAEPFTYNDLSIGGQICYEGLFDTFSANLQNRGAQIIINVTNDSWFGYPFEPNQHMFMTLARAIETRRSLLRVTNTGITSAITDSGEILGFSPHNQPWFGYYELPYFDNPPSTLYAKIAWAWPYVLFMVMLMIIGGDKLAGSRKR